MALERRCSGQHGAQATWITTPRAGAGRRPTTWLRSRCSDQSFHWPEGNRQLRAWKGTRALPAIWEKPAPDVIEKWEAFGAAAEGLAEVAGTGASEMGGGAWNRWAGTCGACHDTLPRVRMMRSGPGHARPRPT